ncbi:YbjN domain-containing protein [Bradyrhizobium huanghuaihaiense]|uniref:YbjN domain-containing protein n=1 Tax=Bradyrhizobium huanghuaihaiense TaxID=990078 RepID=UPI0021AAF62A|nr:YbjN domain-containing protein [Bradyrhizobium sp. CB3035]UWU73895.1 YbjN domain-containing protein [Bradyrhizobium sp. CB3035]
MSNTVIVKLTLDDLRSALQQVGYRVEELTDPVISLTYLRSATGGLTFDIRPGNWLANTESFVDAAFTAVLQVQGELPLDLVNRWNATRRFARLQLSQQFLVLSLDVSVAGGVTADHLRAQIDIWDRLVQELIVYLRDELRELSARKGAAAPVEQAVGYENADVNGQAAALQ